MTTGQQLLHELASELEAKLDMAPEAEREGRIRDLADRALWSGRRRPQA